MRQLDVVIVVSAGNHQPRGGPCPRDFAATLAAVLTGPENSIVVHVGDGAAVLKRSGSDAWEVALSG
ncbi:protein phosphatase 2C domain-containing protein [Sinorhizobium psoraleae]|uniref:protein phosphatase 2C domain-containing protein n=1 Tax=Sinorhizobium psoraleae TaxID=520838 RepID=UPI0035E3E4C7